MATCKSCGANIRFLKIFGSRNLIPVDSIPRRVVRIKEDEFAEIIDGYTTHFETCPDADKFRKKSKGVKKQ